MLRRLAHLLDSEDLAAALCSIAANLGRGGLAIFDLNTLRADRTTFARDSVSVRDDTAFVWRGEGAPGGGPGLLRGRPNRRLRPRDDGLYEHVGTRHEQRHFPREQVVELLSEARLECVGVHGVLDTARTRTS